MDSDSQATVRSGLPSQFSYQQSPFAKPQLSQIGVDKYALAKSLASAQDLEEYMARKDIVEVYTPEFDVSRFDENPWERRGTTDAGIGQNTVPLDAKGRQIMRDAFSNASAFVDPLPRVRLTRGYSPYGQGAEVTINQIEQSLLDSPKSFLARESSNLVADRLENPATENDWLVDNFPGMYQGASYANPPTEYLQEFGERIQNQIAADGRRYIHPRDRNYRY